MSARSSALEVAALAALAACSKTNLPEADPAKVNALFKRVYNNIPMQANAAECAYDQMLGGFNVTRKTMMLLAQEQVDDIPPNADYVNPPELDSPAARTLLDSSDDTERRRAAAELLAAPFYLVYHIDLVDVPLALGYKDFKKGYTGARAIRYDKTGKVVCALSFVWTNTKGKKEWAVAKTTTPKVTPEVRDAMREDLRAQMLKRVAGLGAPPINDPGELADDRHEKQ